MCYKGLQKKWLAWSKGYVVPIERTTLRGVKVYATIARQDVMETTKECNVIWHFFFKICGTGTEPKFRAEELELVVVIDYEDFACAELRREEMEEATSLNVPTKVSGSSFIDVSLIVSSIDHQ
jgi:hypothetical protein